MELQTLRTDIIKHNIPKVLVFIDNNYALMRQYLNAIIDTLRLPLSVYSNIDDALYEISTDILVPSLYFIINDDKALSKLNNLEKYNNYIILYYNNSKDKINNDYVVKFDPLDKYTILGYLLKQCKQNKVTIAQEKLEELIDSCDCNFTYCVNELDKIITLGQENSTIVSEYLLNHNFPDYRKINTHKYIDRILKKDKTVLDDRFKLDESMATFLILLYNKSKQYFTKYKNRYFLDIMKLSYKLQSSILDGTLNEEYVLDYLLYEVFN